MPNLYEIYNSQSDKAQEIIDKYELTRCKMRFYGMNESTSLRDGLELLKKQTISDLEELSEDMYGQELLMAESIRFLMYLLTIQFKPHHDWDIYYRDMLDYFHSKNLLKWKYKYATHKAYKQKRVILTIKDDNVKLPYQSTQAVISDWGRYKADAILSNRIVLGNTMTLQDVLQIVML